MIPIVTPHQSLRRSGFTLVEMLVSLAIVGVLVFLVNQIIGSASMTTMLSQKRMDAVSQAQLVLDRMALDFAQMPVRSDIDYGFSKAAGNDTLSFYSATEGLYPSDNANATPRSMSVVGYRIATDPASTSTAPVLERGARQLDWSAGGPAGDTMHYTLIDGTGGQVQKLDASATNNTLPPIDAAAAATSNYQVFADQVFRMEICYLVSGTASTTGQPMLQTTLPTNISSLSAIVVAIAVLDAKSRALITDYSRLTAAFPDAADGMDLLSLWTPVLNSPNFAKTAGIPPQAAQSVRIFQRYFYLQ